METGKPLISILMAVYRPRMDWFVQQLESLEGQTYPNLALYICDDGSPEDVMEEIRRCVQAHITKFPHRVVQNRCNLGSTKTFERLTREAEGAYFAYCDQDDVWMPEKLDVLYEKIRSEGALLACSDMYIIDSRGETVADSITKVRRHHKFRSGEGLAPGLLISNFVTGCTMLVERSAARGAVPFCPYMVHDHYLALHAAASGKVVSVLRQLIFYRIHRGNQTLMMAGVRDKASYYQIRVRALLQRLRWLQTAFHDTDVLSDEISAALLWAGARDRNFRGERGAKREILRYRRFSPLTSLFEVMFAGAPDFVFMLFIEMKRRNMI